MSERDVGFLARWSRLKQRSREHGAAGSGDADGAAASADVPSVADVAPDSGGHSVRPPASFAASPAPALPAASPVSASPTASHRVADPAEAEVALPPVESLTPESDFRPFMRAGTDSATRNAALKRLFADPQFNVMDGLDVYIDDYGKTQPIPPALLARLIEAHATHVSGDLTEGLSEGPAGCNDGGTADARSDAQRVASADASADASAGHGAGSAAADRREALASGVRAGEAPQACEAPAAEDPSAHASGPGADTDPCSKLDRY